MAVLPLPQGELAKIQPYSEYRRESGDTEPATARLRRGFLLLYPAAPEIRSAANGILFFSRAIKEQN